MRYGRLVLLLLLAVSCNGQRSSGSTRESSPSSGTSAWVVAVKSDGPRWIGPAWWRQEGIDPEALSRDTVVLSRDGSEIPYLWADSPDGPGMLFYGITQPYDFGLAGSYVLELGRAGRQIPLAPEASGQSRACQSSTRATRWYEQDDIYRSTAPLDPPWLWQSIRPPESLEYAVVLTDVVTTEPVTITMRVWGQSSMPADPDHQLRLTWNGAVVENHFWDGAEVEHWDASLSNRAMVENRLEVMAPGETEAQAELTWLDGFGIAWWRTLEAREVWQTWSAEEAGQVCWSLSDANVDPTALVGLLVGSDGLVHEASVLVDGAKAYLPQRDGDVGWLGVPWAAPPPDLLRAKASDLSSGLDQVEYLIVAPAVFHDILQPLAEARRSGGLSVELVTPEAVYDTFGTGLAHPSAVQGMIRALSSSGLLRYVLLVGDASADPRVVWEAESLSVPTAWVRTPFVGHTASDSALAGGGGGEPLVAVGRLPAASEEELKHMVAKLTAWQSGSRLLLVSDDAPEFARLVDDLVAVLPSDAVVSVDEPDARQRVLAWLDGGSGLMVYVGHGSLPMLGDEKLLTYEDAGRWSGPTVVVSWSCLSANFGHPSRSGLAEAWLRAPRGVVAFVGPTGETTTVEQRPMAIAFQQSIARGESVGDALLSAWRAADSLSARQGFVLLGDPALQLLPSSVSAGDGVD